MERTAKDIRLLVAKCIASAGQGHIGGSLSIVDVLTVLYEKYMNVNPSNPHMEGRDRLVLSKGHCAPALYATLAYKGFIKEEELYTLNKIGTHLPSHCDMNKVPGVDMTAGSLGQGISCACGMALASKLASDKATIYCIIGDGESQEGQVWEASMFAAQQKLDNLIVLLDNNKLQLGGYTESINSLIDPVKKWESFGFYVQNIDGNNIEEIDKALALAKKNKGKPSLIVLNTVKGKGIKFVEEATTSNHSMPITKEELEEVERELK